MIHGTSTPQSPPPAAEARAPALPGEDVSTSSTCLLRIRGSSATTLWGLPTRVTSPDAGPSARLCLRPGEAVVVGRKSGGTLDYLDPAYVPTNVEPTSGQPVLRGCERELCVSRGHFTLRGTAGGILLVNGVPRRGGGVRPPLNGTRLLAPARRRLRPAEEYLIERGGSATLRLPNGTEICLHAE